MEEILDQPLNQKDETRINRVTVVFRGLLCIFFLFSIGRIWVYHFISDVSYTDTEDTLFMLIPTLFMLGLIVYNIRHIQLEIKYKYVIPYFKRGFIASFIALNLLFFFTNFAELYREIVSGDYSIELPLSACLVISISVVLFREITYFRRATRLKRLNNQ